MSKIVNTIHPKTTRNIPVVKQVEFFTFAVKENIRHGGSVRSVRRSVSKKVLDHTIELRLGVSDLETGRKAQVFFKLNNATK